MAETLAQKCSGLVNLPCAVSQPYTPVTPDTDSEAEEDEETAADEGSMITGSCKCGGCRFQFPARKVQPNGPSGKLDMANCHCSL
eukprot:s2155_g1.t1